MVKTAMPPKGAQEGDYRYGVVPGARLRNEDAQVVGKWFQRIGAKDAQGIVDEAAKPTAPAVVHDYFEWDDARAGTLYRRGQANRLARSITVRVVTRDAKGGKSELSGPAFYAVREKEQPEEERSEEENGSHRRSYVSFQVVQKEPDYKEQVMADARRELLARRHKYAASLEMFAAEDPALGAAFDAIAALEDKEEDKGKEEGNGHKKPPPEDLNPES